MASVSYRIGGTYDSSAVKKAKNDFESLGDSVKKITGIVKGFAVIKVAQSINKVASATKGVFLEQNTALNKFTIAISKTNINLDKMNALKDKYSLTDSFSKYGKKTGAQAVYQIYEQILKEDDFSEKGLAVFDALGKFESLLESDEAMDKPFDYNESDLTSSSFYHNCDNIGKTKAYELGLIYPQDIGASLSAKPPT